MINLDQMHFLKIHSNGFPYRVLVNGCSALFFESTSGCSAHLPIQQWIRPGQNMLSILPVLPPSTMIGEDSRIEVTMYLGSSIETLPLVQLSRSLTGYVTGNSSDPIVTPFVNRSNILPLKWDASSDLTKKDQLFQSLWIQYSKIHKALEQKNVDLIIELFRERSGDIAVRQGQSLSEFEFALKDQFQKKLQEPGYILWPLKRENVQIAFYAEGKLACLETSDGCSPLLLFNKSEMMCSYFNTYLYQPAGQNDLVIIR